MAFYLNTTKIYPAGVLNAPVTASSGAPLTNDGTNTFWTYPGASGATPGAGWRYRTILTHGYVAAGYKGSNPWRSVNKTWHQTDTTIYCGEQIDRVAAYIDGTFSDYNAYVHGTGGFQTNNTATSCYNLFSGTMRQALSRNFQFFGSGSAPYGYDGNDPKNQGITYGSNAAPYDGHGGWDMSTARYNHSCASTQINGAGYVYGGGTTVTEKMNFPTEVMYTTTATPITWSATAAIGGETRAYIVGNNSTSACYYMTFSNDTFTTWGYNGGYNEGYNKSLMSKWGFFYTGAYENRNTTRWKFNDSTGAYISALTKLSNFGEEQQQMGQDWGYMLGCFNGQQNNWTTKTTYSNDAEATLGFAAQPKGHYGISSGAASSAAATIVGVQRA